MSHSNGSAVSPQPPAIDLPILRPRMPELDTVRGFAVLAVVVYHGIFWSANTAGMSRVDRMIVQASLPGWLGVQLFFVLSGFLITGILLDGRSDPAYYRRFYFRRAVRILPAYVALLVVLALLGHAQWPFLLASILFVANLASTFGIPMQYGPLWSLAVEEQFYLVWPLIVRRTTKSQLALVCLAIIVLTPLARYVAFRHGVVDELASRTWFVSDALAAGALLALLLRTPGVSRRRVGEVSTALVGTGALALGIGARAGIFHRTSPVGATFQIAPWHLIFAGVIGLVVLVGSGPSARFVRSRALEVLGRISYGLYLIHLLAFELFDTVFAHVMPALSSAVSSSLPLLLLRLCLGGGAGVAFAWLSRETFEEYFLRNGKRGDSRDRPSAHAARSAND